MAMLVAACGGDGEPLRRASEHARRHVPAFERYERWAQRVARGDAAARGGDALSELLFAPVRNAPDVLAVFVRLDGRPLALPARAELTAPRTWVSLRGLDRGTALHAAVEASCPIALPRRAAPAGACVLLANHRAGESPRIAIAIAFRDEPYPRPMNLAAK